MLKLQSKGVLPFWHNKNEIIQNVQQTFFKYKKKDKKNCTNGLSCVWLAGNKCLFTHDEEKIEKEGNILNSKCNITSKDQLTDKVNFD